MLRPWAIPRAMNPAGGVITTIGDLLHNGEFHLGAAHSGTGAELLSIPARRQMQETQVVKHGSDEEMALGWQVSRIGRFREVWHDGFAVGQAALLLLVPSEQLAVGVLTNSHAGERLNRDIRRAVAAEYLGVDPVDPSPIAVPGAELAKYAGRYSRPFMDIIVTIDAGRVMIQQIQKQGFPTPNAPVPPLSAPAPYMFYATDRLIGLGPVGGHRAEFIRGADGTIGWIRTNDRVARRAD